GPFGILHEMKYFNFILETPDEAVRRLDDVGGPHSHANYPWGWAQAGNTPFKWYKQNTHEGGVHVPLIVHWPRKIADAGAIRQQFHYVTDVAPTIYDALGVTPPTTYRGLAQMPLAGQSMAYAFSNDATSEASNTRRTQYFEMGGHRALYHDGLKAVTRHVPGVDFDEDVWELYDVTRDPSECHDLSTTRPDELAALITRWWDEAERYGVLPLDDRTIELFAPRFREFSPHPLSRHYTYYPPLSPVPPQAAAGLGGRRWNLEARVERAAGQGGVILASGNENAGLSLFILDDRLVFDYNVFGEHLLLTSTEPVPVGDVVLGVSFQRTDRAAEVTLLVNGAASGSLHLPFVMRIISSTGMSIGRDHGSPVSTLYHDEFAFQGQLRRVDIQLVSVDQDRNESAAREGMARQ
ncbi:MAG: sulfatase-like hydrolase/transferase, partial [Acidobacteriota bacterium]|nr:sulfatase-like hydrolase/transferase [Acidobacteriota bacterium]